MQIEKIICPYCGKEFKRITKNHLDKHGVSYDQYLKEYQPIRYLENLLIKFFDDYYITIRSKYLVYPPTGDTYTISTSNITERVDKVTGEVKEYKPLPLCKKLLQNHIRQKETIGILFPTMGTKIIGLDLDIKDTGALERVCIYLTRYIPSTSILTSCSGNKGYHIDIFLDRILGRDIVNKFYDMILANTGLDKHQLELRGGNNQGYKLPFGMHFKSNAFCGAVDFKGNSISDIEQVVTTRTKVDTQIILDLVFQSDIDEEIAITETEILSDDEIVEFEDISAEVTPLANYSNLNEDFIEDLALIYRNGFNQSGVRHKYVLKIALFLKSHMRFNKKIVLEEMYAWMERCSNYNASAKEFEADIKNTVDKIFDEDMKLTVAAREIKISKVEIKEILSIKCRTSQQTRALRLLYYMMFLHSKAYANADGVFFMTLDQMQFMGARRNRTELLKQISKLTELKKVYKYPSKRVSRTKYAPSEYKLIALSDIVIELGTRTFTICDDMSQCSDCMDKATDFLIRNTAERRMYRKGKCLNCPHNKR